MSKNLKITIIVFSVVLVIGFAFLATVTGLTWQYFTGMFTGETYYTQEQYDDFGEENKNTAFKNKEQLESELEELRAKILEQNTQIFNLKNQVGELQNENLDLKNQKEQAIKEKESIESQILGLEQTISENETKMSENSAEIIRLKSELEKQKGQSSVDQATIDSLNSRIQGLETINSQLIVTNQSHANTIVELNKNITDLNQKIIELNKQITSNTNSASALNSRIAQLEKSIQTYETFIAQFSVDDKVVATFEFDGGIYNIQLVNKGSVAVVGDPPSTDFVIFNFWEVDGQKVDNLATYYLSQNTKFVANVTYKYSVKFMVDDQQIEEQIVEKNGHATNPSHATSKDGYEFEGWTLNGSDIIDVSSVEITQNTTFIAKFVKLYDVTFMYEQETKSTQKVKSGECAEDVSVDSTTYKKFNGWKVDNDIVTITEYPIFADTIFVADITYSYDVKFMVDNQQYGETQIIEHGKFASKQSDPAKDEYKFLGWTLNGVDVVKVESTPITQTTTFIAKFTNVKYSVQFLDYNFNLLDSQNVFELDCASTEIVPSFENYKFVGWSKDGSTVLDLNSTPITSDTVFIACYVYNYAGIWKGKTISAPNGEVYEMTMYVSDSGLFFIDTNDSVNFSFDLFMRQYIDNSRKYPDATMLLSKLGVREYYVAWSGDTVKLYDGRGLIVFQLTKVEDHLESDSLVSDALIKTNSKMNDKTDTELYLSNFYFKDNSNKYFIFVKDSKIYCYRDVFIDTYGPLSFTYEITDSSFTLGNVVYTYN